MATRKAGKPGLPDDQAEHVLRLLRKVLHERFGDRRVDLASALGISGPAVSLLAKAQGNKPSYETAKALAGLVGASVEDVLEGRVDHLANHPPPAAQAANTQSEIKSTRTIEYEPRYRNAAIALRRLRDGATKISEETADQILNAVALESEEDPPVAFWCEQLLQQEKLNQKFRNATIEQVRAALGGRPLDDSTSPESVDDSGIRENGHVVAKLREKQKP